MASPPRWPINLLHSLCNPGLVEEIEGDLNEDYYRRLETKGRRYASALFCLEALAFLRPQLLKRRFTLIQTTMIRSYIILSVRSMIKKPLFTLINLFGLTLGLASVLVIAGYVLFMLSYDKQYPSANNLYRVTLNWKNDGVQQHTATAFSPVASALDKTIHGVKRVSRVYPYSGLVSKDGIDKTREARFCYADSLFFEMFPMTFQQGHMGSALKTPFSVVLTERMANKYFGTVEVLGKELRYEDERGSYRFNVTGVIDNLPQNTHFNPDFIASLTTLDKIMPWYNNWFYPPMYVYVEAQSGYDARQLESQISAAITKTHPNYIKSGDREYYLQPVTDIHLHSNLVEEWQANSNYIYVQILTVVAALILFLACINYVNLSTARSAERAKEVGVRKVMGAIRRQLIGQFLGESFVTALIAMILAFGLAELIFRFYLNDLLEKDLSIYTLFEPVHLITAFGGLIGLTLVAGMYPAFFLSMFRPASVLNNSQSKTGGGLMLQRSMVAFQFVVSCLLIVGMLTIEKQTSYLREKRLGFEKDQLVAILLFDRKMGPKYQALKSRLLSESVVKHVAVSSGFPLREGFNGWPVTPEGHTAEERMSMKSLGGDVDLVKTLNLEIIAGRDFSADNPADTTQAFIINEAAAKSLNWNDPVGKDFELIFYARGENRRKGKVIGVVKDFHFESLYNKIDPLVIFVNTHPFYCDYLLVKLNPGNIAKSMAALQTGWKDFSADKPLEYIIANDDLSDLYRQESKLSSMFSSFSALSVIVSCLGLFGLSAYAISRRIKEIGIRMVMGASVRDLFGLLSREYLLLVFLAQLLAWPLAWWLTGEWLSSFAYKVDVPLTFYLISLAACFVLAMVSISVHILRAVRISPIKTLRIE